MQYFRGFSDLTLEFSPNAPTVLIGVNGVGNSSILDCLAILFFCFSAFLNNEFKYNLETDQYRVNTKNKSIFKGINIKNE